LAGAAACTITPYSFLDAHKHEDPDFELEPDVIIVDAPAGMHGQRLKTAVKHVDQVLIPVQPSPLDMNTTDDFINLLSELKRVRKGKCPLALVGSRVHRRTLSTGQLQTFFDKLDLPVLSLIRDAQIYVQMAKEGTTLFDLPRYRVSRDLQQWRGIIAWLTG
jgi:chromosome partitioning protein